MASLEIRRSSLLLVQLSVAARGLLEKSDAEGENHFFLVCSLYVVIKLHLLHDVPANRNTFPVGDTETAWLVGAHCYRAFKLREHISYKYKCFAK